MTDIRWMFGRSKNKYEIKGVKYLDIHFQEEGEDWSYYKPTDRPYRCIYVFEAEEDEEEAQEEEVWCAKCRIPLTEDDINCGNGNCEDCGYEEDETQYKEPCANCDTILTIDTPIMCYTEPDGNDFTVCSRCYWECEFYETDINEDNKEEIEEHIFEETDCLCGNNNEKSWWSVWEGLLAPEQRFMTCKDCVDGVRKQFITEEDAYWCVDCGKDFDWIKGKSYSGQGVNSYHCGICDKPKWAAHNKRYNLN